MNLVYKKAANLCPIIHSWFIRAFNGSHRGMICQLLWAGWLTLSAPSVCISEFQKDVWRYLVRFYSPVSYSTLFYIYYFDGSFYEVTRRGKPYNPTPVLVIWITKSTYLYCFNYLDNTDLRRIIYTNLRMVLRKMYNIICRVACLSLNNEILM